ncbi:MAG: response regulator [Deltaproteobacteria bacterium]|nr:response regulator [Deltaproteobacteria bacterium]
MTTILVADDEDSILQGFTAALGGQDAYAVTTVGSGEEAVARLAAEPFDLVFTDLRMPGMTGIDVIREGRKTRPDAEFVLMTGYGSVGTAVDAMKLGAVDYVEKPFRASELVRHVRKAERARAERIRRAEEERGFVRFTPGMRFQHVVLMLTFFVLTVTGVPLMFPDLFRGVFFFEDSSLLRSILHRVAAVGLMLACVLHVVWAIVTDEGHANIRAILPRLPKDLFDFFEDIGYCLGLRKERPKVGKYNWVEKFEYFALVWGTIVKIVSGLVLWFTDAVLHVAPLWVIDLAKVVHRYEAILAILSVVVWHMYTVHLRPGTFPMSRVWLDGKISREDMLHHHPLEYEALTGRPAHDEHGATHDGGAAHGGGAAADGREARA